MQIIELYPEADHNQPPRSYRIRTTRTSPDTIYYDQQAADADQQSQPDDHYYQAQGQEPPPALDNSYPLLGLAMLFIICGGSVVTVWALFGYVLPVVVGWLFKAAGA